MEQNQESIRSRSGNWIDGRAMEWHSTAQTCRSSFCSHIDRKDRRILHVLIEWLTQPSSSRIGGRWARDSKGKAERQQDPIISRLSYD